MSIFRNFIFSNNDKYHSLFFVNIGSFGCERIAVAINHTRTLKHQLKSKALKALSEVTCGVGR